MKLTLDYEFSRRPQEWCRLPTLAIAAIAAGLLTSSSVFVGGYKLPLVIGPCLGVALTAVAVLVSPGSEIRSSLIASTFAAVAAWLSGLVFVVYLERGNLYLAPIFEFVVAFLIVMWLHFAIPGLLLIGSLWFWKGWPPLEVFKVRRG